MTAANAAPPIVGGSSPAWRREQAEFLSPFASLYVQQQGTSTPAAAPASPPEPSRSNSPVRVVGFQSSPTSVVALRRWQSAADPGSASALEQAAAIEAAVAVAGAGVDPGSNSTRFTPQRLSTKQHESGLGAALKQQEQLASLQKRLSIHTGRALTAGGRGKTSSRRMQQTAAATLGGRRHSFDPPPAACGGAPITAVIAEDLEQDWIAALTPGSSELKEAAAAEAAAAGRLPPQPPAITSHVSFDLLASTCSPAQLGTGTLPAGCGSTMHLATPQLLPSPFSTAGGGGHASGLLRAGSGLPPVHVLAPMRQRSTAMTGAGSASIDIPYHNMRRAETAPALTDDLIAAAIAACGNSSAASSHKSSAAAAAAPGGGGSVPPSSGSSSCRPSPPGAAAGQACAGTATLPTLCQRQASAAREMFEAQAEAVAAQTQSKVLQQALAQEQDRVAKLERQLSRLLLERAEDKARLAQQLLAQQEQQQALLRIMQQQAQPQALLLPQHEHEVWGHDGHLPMHLPLQRLPAMHQQAHQQAPPHEQAWGHGGHQPMQHTLYMQQQALPPRHEQAWGHGGHPPMHRMPQQLPPQQHEQAWGYGGHVPLQRLPLPQQQAPGVGRPAVGLERHEMTNYDELAAALAALGH